jgi:hypothetical protein
MARFKLHLTSVSFFILAIMFSGWFPSHSDSSRERGRHNPVFDASYRSPSTTHKVIVQASEPQLRDSILAEGGTVIEDYGAFTLMSAPDATASRVSLQSAPRGQQCATI